MDGIDYEHVRLDARRLTRERDMIDEAVAAAVTLLRAELAVEVEALTRRIDEVHARALRALTDALERRPNE